jgi:hypothetical protein
MQRSAHPTRKLLTIAFYCAILLPGCVERSENLKVRPDGQITANIRVTADQPSELTPGRVPGYFQPNSTRTEKDPQSGKTIFTASQTFTSASQLPANDAAPDDLLAKTYVQSPTILKTERRSDGTYYQFKRTYTARPCAWLAYLDDRPGSQEFKAVLGKPSGSVPLEQWTKAINFGIQTQVLKKLEQARAISLQPGMEVSQDKWLKARERLLQTIPLIDVSNLATLVQANKQDPSSQIAITAAIHLIESQIDAALMDAIAGTGYTGPQMQKFKGLMNQAKSQESATNDARGTTYKITVELPGEPVGSNATSSSNNTFTWEFKGDAFCDRDLELLATTKLR